MRWSTRPAMVAAVVFNLCICLVAAAGPIEAGSVWLEEGVQLVGGAVWLNEAVQPNEAVQLNEGELKGEWTSTVVVTAGKGSVPEWRCENGIELAVDLKAGNTGAEAGNTGAEAGNTGTKAGGAGMKSGGAGTKASNAGTKAVKSQRLSLDLAATFPVPASEGIGGRLGLELDLGLGPGTRLRSGVAALRKPDRDDSADTAETLSGQLNLDLKGSGAALLRGHWSAARVDYPFRRESLHFKADEGLSLRLVPKTGALRGARAEVELIRASKDYPLKPETSSLTRMTSIGVKTPQVGRLGLTISAQERAKEYPFDLEKSYRQRAVGGELSVDASQVGASRNVLITLSFSKKHRDYLWSEEKCYQARSAGVAGKWTPAKNLEILLSSNIEDKVVPGNPAGDYTLKEGELRVDYRPHPSLGLTVRMSGVTKIYRHEPSEDYRTRVFGLDISHTIRDGLKIAFQLQSKHKHYPSDPSGAEEVYRLESSISCPI